jgi:glycosyltransferase involved in cell wall biosynthesis
VNPRVVWVSFAPLKKSPRGWTSNLASVRYRVTIPSAALERGGWSSRVTHLGTHANRQTLLARFRDADAVVFGKYIATGPEFSVTAQRVLDLAGGLSRHGKRILADFSDDHFSHPQFGPFFKALVQVADCSVAATPGLAEVLRQAGAQRVAIVTDPVEGQRGEPRVRDLASNPVTATAPFRVLWFGHPSNLDTLRFALSSLERLGRGTPLLLTLVTASGAGAEELASEIDRTWHSMSNGARFVPWSTDAVFDALRDTDLVIIPSDPYDPRRSVKSPNRFTESVWAGRFVAANPLPAYEALAAAGWVGEDVGEGISWYLAHAGEAEARIAAGQTLVEREHSPTAVAEAWKTAILAVLGR